VAHKRASELSNRETKVEEGAGAEARAEGMGKCKQLAPFHVFTIVFIKSKLV